MHFAWQSDVDAERALSQLRQTEPERELSFDLQIVNAPVIPRSQRAPPPDALGLPAVTVFAVDPTANRVRYPDACSAVIAPQGLNFSRSNFEV